MKGERASTVQRSAARGYDIPLENEGFLGSLT